MKKFISILLIMTLIVSAFTMTSISAFAEGEDEVVDNNTTTEGGTPEGDGNLGDGAEEGGDSNLGDGTEEGGDGNLGDGTEEGGDGNLGDGTEEGGDGNLGDGTEEGGEGATDGEGGDEEGESNPLVDFLASFIPVDALEGLANALFGIIGDMWNFVSNHETYGTIATAVLGGLAFLAIPFVFGVIVVVYAAIGGMIMFAGALVGVAEMFLGIVPSLFA